MGCLDLIKVKLGREDIDARPIEWKYDCDGNPLDALAFMTTCHKCSQLINFRITEIVDGRIDCNICHCGQSEMRQKIQELVVKNVIVTNEFIEPISMGLMEHP